MKTKFSNAEKVSDKFLKLRYEEFKKRLNELNWTRFVTELDKIFGSDEDNYEKLKKIVHLEREFDNYIRSKAFFFDLMSMEFSDGNIAPYGIDHFTISSAVEGDKLYYNNGCSEAEFVDLCIKELLQGKEHWNKQVSEHDKEKFYLYLSRKYMKNEEKNIIAYLIKLLEDSDISKFAELLRSHFANIFRKIMSSNEETFKNETNGMISRNITFDATVSNATITFITKVNMDVYWKLFNYPPEDERANSFRQFIIEKFESNLVYFAKRKEFWYLLLNFDSFCININKSSREISYSRNILSGTQECERKQRKITESDFAGIFSANIWYNLDLSEVDLRKFDLSDKIIINCNLQGTGAKIDITTLNSNSSVHYIHGRQIDRFNLVDSCFKGCTIVNANSETLNKFVFSSDTFDSDIAFRCDTNLENVAQEIREKYYRKIVPTEPELEVLFVSHVDAVRRYGDLIKNSKFTWLLYFDMVSKMPYIEDKI